MLIILAEIAIAAGGITMTLLHGVPFWVWPTITGVCLIALPIVAYGRNIARALRRIKDALKDAPDKSPSPAVDYVTACDIVDGYIQHATVGMRPGVKLSVRHDIMTRFEDSVGAMLGDGIYNGERLHLWIQSNAARFLVENRGKMS